MPCDAADLLRQRQVLDALPVLIFLERAGRIVFANAEARSALGESEPDWVERPLEDVIWGLFPGSAEPQTLLTARNGSAFHATLAGSGGRIIPIEGTYQTSNPALREGVIVAHTTAREPASKPRLMEDVLASLPEAVAIVLGRNVLYTNPAFTQMFGFTADEVSGGSLRDFIVPESRQHEHAAMLRQMEDRGRVSLDTVRTTKDGDLVDVAMMVSPLMIAGSKAGQVFTFRDIGERKQVEARLQHDAMHDVLTGLPNKILFEDHVKLAMSRRARRAEQGCGVLMLELDGVRGVNERCGQAAGDLLVAQVAGRLRSVIRPHDTAARVGEEAFGVLLENLSTIADMEAVAHRVLGVFAQVFEVLGHRIEVAISMGAAIAASETADAETLVHNAEVALYRAKQVAGQRLEIFDRQMHVPLGDFEEQDRNLRQVLAQHEYEFWYQPFYRLATGQVDGFESLLRWRHADGSVDSFRDLLPVAENTGASVKVGRETLESAWMQLRNWNQIAPGNGLQISINLTHRQFYSDDLVGDAQRVIMSGGAEPWQLLFEVSEATVNEHPDRALAILQRLVDCGVRVALDNFGAGMAALQHLVRLPIHMVKLDPTLTRVSDMSTRRIAVLEGMLHVAKAAGIQSVAQGLETDEQYRFAAEMGCELGQGHRLSPPVNAERAGILVGAIRGNSPEAG